MTGCHNQFVNVDNFIFIGSPTILINMEHTIDTLSYDLSIIEDGRIRVIISEDGGELGTLYFERAKKSFSRKPVTMNGWVCIDAKIEGLYELTLGQDITPKTIVGKCQSLIKDYLL